MWNVFSGLLSTHVCQSQTSNNPYVEPVSIILTILSAAYAAFQFPKVWAALLGVAVALLPLFSLRLNWLCCRLCFPFA